MSIEVTYLVQRRIVADEYGEMWRECGYFSDQGEAQTYYDTLAEHNPEMDIRLAVTTWEVLAQREGAAKNE